MRPEPEQQNLAVYWESLRRLLRMPRSTPRGSPVLREVFSRFGLGDVDNLRVIVCDGPSLLAYVGAFQSDGFDDTQRRTLQRLVPALKRRLIVERLLLQGDTSRAMFDAAFSAIPSAAFVTDAQGTLRELNAAGSAWFEHDARAVRDALRVAVKRGGSPRFAVTRIVAGGAPNLRLVVQVRGGDLSSAHRSRAAAARWSFTARQAQVLALLVDGSTTRTIAAELAVSEKTIEAHLTAMFDKAQVGSRAALVAAAWRQA
jgi:DNA-binding CsgD family transcriptional regulator